MGTTNKIKDVLQTYELKKRTCALCSQPLKDQDNINVYFRTNNDTQWLWLNQGQSRGWIALEIQLEHEECPE